MMRARAEKPCWAPRAVPRSLAPDPGHHQRVERRGAQALADGDEEERDHEIDAPMDRGEEDEPERLGDQTEPQAPGLAQARRQRAYQPTLHDNGHHPDHGEDGADVARAEAEAALAEQREASPRRR